MNAFFFLPLQQRSKLVLGLALTGLTAISAELVKSDIRNAHERLLHT